MKTTQHTIQAPVAISGIGVHTGHVSHLTCLPAAPNHGIQFQRIDLPGQPTLKAVAEHVVDTTRSTTLGYQEIRISTVEHLLAALGGLEIDNMLIQLDGPEVPILDGSAAPFVEAFQQIGLVDQGIARCFFSIPESISHTHETQKISAFPLDTYQLAVLVHYAHPAIQSQHASLNNLQDIPHDIAPSLCKRKTRC